MEKRTLAKAAVHCCDGLPKTGQAWVRSALLAATVFVPPNTGQAIEMLSQAIQASKTCRSVPSPFPFPSPRSTLCLLLNSGPI